MFLSLSDHQYQPLNDSQPAEGDLKSEDGQVLFRFDGHQWRRCCRHCLQQAKPVYCQQHDPISSRRAIHFFSLRQNKHLRLDRDHLAEEGDMRCEGEEVFRYSAKQWRKCCKYCLQQAKPVYCRRHDPDNRSCAQGKGYSKMACDVLDRLSAELGIDIVHQHIDVTGPCAKHHEFRVPGTLFRVDGYDPCTRSVYEVLGDYWHGNPNVFDGKIMNKSAHKTFGELWQRTFARFRIIAGLGYTVRYIWEREWRKLQSLPRASLDKAFTTYEIGEPSRKRRKTR
jgi:hypothetical protein